MNIYTRETSRQSYFPPRQRVILAWLVGWLGLEEHTRLPWSARLPCVLFASVLLVMLISGIGVPTRDIYFVLILPLLGLPATLFLKKRDG